MGGKKKGRQKQSKTSLLQDFPITVFADSPEKGIAMRKSQSGSLMEVVASVKQTEMVPDSWDDDVLEEKDPEEERVLKIRDPEVKTQLWLPRSKKENYLRLPIDFWHMLANYIPPHEIGLFARICHSAHSVTLTHSFWRRLYLRNCHAGTQDQLPQRLSTSTLLHRPRGLRACVIRALHITHQPFVAAARASGWPDPQRLIGATCMLHWTKRSAQKQVTFFFKLRDAAVDRKVARRGRVEEKEDWYKEHGEDVEEGEEERFLEEMSDIGHNPEEGCRVMQVGSAAWSKVPPVMGLQLRSVGLSVSGLGMRFHKLSLEFGTELRVIKIVLEPVTSLKILPWWSPAYPVEGEGSTCRAPALTADPWGV